MQSQIRAELLPCSLHPDQLSARTPQPEPRVSCSSLAVQTQVVYVHLNSAGIITSSPIRPGFIFPPGDLLAPAGSQPITAVCVSAAVLNCEAVRWPGGAEMKSAHQLFWEMFPAQFALLGSIHPVYEIIIII